MCIHVCCTRMCVLHVCVRTCARMHVGACAHVCVYMHASKCVCALVCVRVYVHVSGCGCVCVHGHACTCVHAITAWRPGAQAAFPGETEDMNVVQTVAAGVPVSSPRLGAAHPSAGQACNEGINFSPPRPQPQHGCLVTFPQANPLPTSETGSAYALGFRPRALAHSLGQTGQLGPRGPALVSPQMS